MLFTTVVAIAQTAEAETFPQQFFPPEQLRAYPVPEHQQLQAVQEFYITQTDLVVLERALLASGLPLNQLEIETVLPIGDRLSH